MLKIGLTGGIGTGKSEVSRLLEKLGATVINADQVGHQAYTPHSETWQAVVAAFGEGILQPDGQIDRRKLGGIVFSDPQQLTRLNEIMHPRMAHMVARQLDGLRAQGVNVAVVEAAVLFEAHWDALVDEVWVVDAPASVVVERVQARNNLTEAQIRQRIESQMTAAERRALATVVIDNGGNLAALEKQVRFLWESRVKRKERAE